MLKVVSPFLNEGWGERASGLASGKAFRWHGLVVSTPNSRSISVIGYAPVEDERSARRKSSFRSNSGKFFGLWFRQQNTVHYASFLLTSHFSLSAKPGTSLWSCTAGIVLVVLGGVTGEESEDVEDTTHTFYHAKSILPPKLTLTLTKTINL